MHAMADHFWSEIWEEWFRPLAKECLKTFSILAVLYAVWEVIALMRFSGYPEDYLESIEKVHFAFMYVSLLVLGSNFVIKLVISTWSVKQKDR
jgi:hypothetical protein